MACEISDTTVQLLTLVPVQTWGLGQDGRLGHGDTASQWLPMRVEALADVIVSQVACGGLHTAVLTVEGECYTFGLGKDGRLGLGGDEHRLLPSLVAELSDYRIVQVACGGHHTAALTDEGKVWMWGFDDDGKSESAIAAFALLND